MFPDHRGMYSLNRIEEDGGELVFSDGNAEEDVRRSGEETEEKKEVMEVDGI
jgi:hypothetical protein